MLFWIDCIRGSLVFELAIVSGGAYVTKTSAKPISQRSSRTKLLVVYVFACFFVVYWIKTKFITQFTILEQFVPDQKVVLV